jgi:hypothetical protein
VEVDSHNNTGDPRFGKLLNSNLIDLGNPLASEEDRQMLRYSKIVEEYCQKKFTYTDDILDAFAGIEAILEHLCGWKMVYGLPEQLLQLALPWEPEGDTASQENADHALVRRAKATTAFASGTHELEVRNSKLPSCSWAAWIGGVCYNIWTVSEIRVFHSPFEIGMSASSGHRHASLTLGQ